MREGKIKDRKSLEEFLLLRQIEEKLTKSGNTKLITTYQGYTPKKGVDYFTEKEIKSWLDTITPKKGKHYFDGYTPKKGVDYFTKKEIDEIIEIIKDEITPKIIRDEITPKKGIDYFDGKNGRTPLFSGKNNPKNPQIGDLWIRY